MSGIFCVNERSKSLCGTDERIRDFVFTMTYNLIYYKSNQTWFLDWKQNIFYPISYMGYPILKTDTFLLMEGIGFNPIVGIIS